MINKDNSTPKDQVSHQSNLHSDIKNLCSAGLYLVPIPPRDGKPTKGPRNKGWNKPRSKDNPNGYSNNPDDFISYSEDYNFGLYHGASNTLALDLDNVALAGQVFEKLIDPQHFDWSKNEQRAEVKSPKPNRGKFLFKLPPGFDGAQLRQLKHGNEVVFELRCGNCQDVIIGQHPEGGNYQFIGNLEAIPEAPVILLDMLQNWEAWKPCFASVLDPELEPPKIAPRAPQRGEHIPGWRNPIDEFNQTFTLEEILIRNDYTPAGNDRFIRPGSTSGAPGVVILKNCKDGVERAFSHGGDELSNGFAHDAFDCYRLLECNGVW